MFNWSLKWRFPKIVKVILSQTFYTKDNLMMATDKKNFKRLPQNVKPVLYDLFLKPDLQKFTFEGKETISLYVVESTKVITLHALDLKIEDVELQENDGSILKPTISISSIDETLTLNFEKELKMGEAFLKFVFVGELNDKMKGFYRSKYISPSGEEHYSAVTQFEATDARRCFPCWDEPAIKAEFDILLSVPNSKTALSNMPVISDVIEENGDRLVKFQRTPIMSTYLVAVVVGEFDYVEDKDSDGVLIRVYTPVGKSEQGKFALEVSKCALPYYKDYFQVAYPLPKMDLIAIADFSSGAMENWGLVTYRESCLLVDPANTSAVRKQWIALVVGHELAHQWFGNLVTMEWWTHLWLNEGYASFVEFLCVEYLFPEYDIWTQFVTDTYIRSLELDALNNSHPIEIPVGHPSEIDEIFDDISYNKGASVIRMLHNFIGDEDFRKGMNLYLTKHQYSNTFTEDLWAALEEASNKPVKAVMSTWTLQKGFPVITIEKEEENSDGSRVLTVSQRKFTADGQVDDKGSLWMVPLTFSTSRNPNIVCHKDIMDKYKTTITIPANIIAPGEWLKVNPSTVGYYRTCYTPKLLKNFIPSISSKTLPPLDRLGLLDDLSALVQAGLSRTDEVLDLMLAMTDEDNYSVWSTMSNLLGKLSILLSNVEGETEQLFKQYSRILLKKIAAKLGWNPKPKESHLETLLRGLVIARLVLSADPNTIVEAKTRFANHLSGKETIVADLRSPIYKACLSNGDETTFNQLLQLYRGTDLHEEKDRICRAMGSSKNEAILKKVLDFAMSDEVRSQDTVFVIISVGASKVGRDLAWQFIQDNWTKLFNQYQGGFLLTRLVKNTTENFASIEKAEEVENFFKKNGCMGAERTIQQACETIRLNAAWLKRDHDQLHKFLQETVKNECI
ncbi:puromycin-sensitive aminopeptidase isoform X2 [Daktulosphaira vitifoliae]|uniref:puromycin-sensitive aminopeptidase isoform X2 n=1 Tax=Daktulosphaira vitifoliae TaxID=58002 RepID=UPI0021AA0BB5|nr:puromycin-sensitive aminopeptidase isoform X2 [Daktulosphaira vitifoliae]